MPANFPLGVSDDDRIVFDLTSLIWERGTAPSSGAPTRVVFPIFDDSAAAPLLTYKATQGGGAVEITIEGENLTGITTVDVSRDVDAAGNTGTAPTVSGIVVTADTVVATLDCSSCTTGDYWGVNLSDASGNEYGAPSPLRITVGI